MVIYPGSAIGQDRSKASTSPASRQKTSFIVESMQSPPPDASNLPTDDFAGIDPLESLANQDSQMSEGEIIDSEPSLATPRNGEAKAKVCGYSSSQNP